MASDKRWRVLGGLLLARIVVAFQFQSAATVAPGLRADLGLDLVAIGMLVGIFMLPGIVLSLPGSVLSRLIGEKRFLILCMALMVVGGALCGVAEDFQTLWVGRLIAGFGGVGLNVAMSKVVIDWFAGREINTAMGFFLATFPTGIAIALLTLSHVAGPGEWRLAFHATAFFSLIALVVFVATYRPGPHAITAAAQPATLWGGGLSRREFFMVSLAGLVWGVFNLAYVMAINYVPVYLVARGMEMVTAASLFGIGLWITVFSAPVGGAVIDRFGRPTLFIAGSVLLWGCGLLLSIPFAGAIAPLAALFAATQFAGTFGVGAIVALSAEVLRAQSRQIGMGVFYTFLYAGLAFGPVLGGYVNEASGDAAAALYTVAALSVLLVLLLLGFRLLQARQRPPATAPAGPAPAR